MNLFLYGTLMGEADTAMGRWLHERVAHVQPATVPGVIHAIPSAKGWYSALLRGPGRVRGVVADCTLDRRDVVRLDRYEGHEYRRKAMRARTADGTTVAQAWIWRGPLPQGAVAIADGDFLGWLAKSGNAILSSRNGF